MRLRVQERTIPEALALLGIDLPRPATEEGLAAWKDNDLPKAYKAAVRANHPDLGTTDEDRAARTEKMKAINGAREQLAAVKVRAASQRRGIYPESYPNPSHVRNSSFRDSENAWADIFGERIRRAREEESRRAAKQSWGRTDRGSSSGGFGPNAGPRADTFNDWERKQAEPPPFIRPKVCARCGVLFNPLNLHVCEEWKTCRKCNTQWRGSHNCRVKDTNVETATGSDLDDIGLNLGLNRKSFVDKTNGVLMHESDATYRKRLQDAPNEMEVQRALDDLMLCMGVGEVLDEVGKRWGCPRHGPAEADSAYRDRLRGWRHRP